MIAQRHCKIEITRRYPDYPIACVVRFIGRDGETKLALPCRLSGALTVLNGVPADPAWRTEIVSAETDADIEVQTTPSGTAWALARSAARLLGVTRGSFRTVAKTLETPPVSPWEALAPTHDPSVTIIIPTRDRADLLSRAVDTLFVSPARAATDLVIVDNGSVEASTFGLFEALTKNPAIRVLRVDEPFNFARLINRGAALARGEVLAVINNDVWSSDPTWCDRLASLASDARVAAVGAKLLQPDGRVQHAGITLGIGGLCGHAGRGRSKDDPGPGAMLTTTRQVSAVTGACLLTRRAVFEELGGFDERYVVEFNDVDYCLRGTMRGLVTLYAASPTLTHAEGSTRKTQPVRRNEYEDRLRFVAQWGRQIVFDPHYPQGLSYDNEFLAPASHG